MVSEEYDVIWSRWSVRDLDEILDYVADDRGIDRALQLYEKMRKEVASLATIPRRCRQVPELLEIGLLEHRELVLPPYRIFFRIDHQKVILLGILDSRRDLERLLIQRACEFPDPDS